MIAIKWFILFVVFLLELAALAAFGYWGFRNHSTLLIKIVLGIGTPLLVAVIWGTFLSPKASIPVPALVNLLLKLAVFGTAAAALYGAGQRPLAAVFLALAVLATLGCYVMKW